MFYKMHLLNDESLFMPWQSSTIKEVNNCDLGVLEKSKVVGVVVEVLVVAIVVLSRIVDDGVVLHLVFSFSI